MFFLLATMVLWFFLLLLSALWWRRLRGLCQLTDRRDWWWEKWGLALVDRALLNKANPIICWWVGLCSLSDSRLAREDPVLGSTGCMVGLTSKRAYTMGDLLNLLLPVPPSLWWAPANPGLHRRTSNTNKEILIQSPVGSLLLSSGSWCMQDFICALQDWSLCFPQSCGSPVIKFHWPSRSDSLGISSPFVRSPGWDVWCWVQNLHNSGKTSLVLLFCGLWVTHLVGMGFDFIMIVPLLPSSSSFLSLGIGYLFWYLFPAFSCQWLFRR